MSLVGAASLMVGGCTIEDASDKRAADSAAAATSQTGMGQPAPSGVQPAPASTPVAGMPSQDSAGGAVAGTAPMTGASPTTGESPATGASPSGNLSPDSVDVGRKAKDALPLSRTRLEVDLAARQLYVYDGDQRVATYRVAVGSPEWPTQTGQWNVAQVVWNPEWVPPDETWAEQRTPKKPGASDNPLGSAQIVYDPPRTIHGTNEPASIGKAVSHGSIRLANTDATRLARHLMESTGVTKDEAWYRNVQQKRTEKVPVNLPQRVPIRIF